MKVGIFSDLHLHNYQAFSKPVGGGLTSRSVFCLDILQQINSIARGETVQVPGGLGAIFFCGDFWHTQGYVLVPLYQAAYEMMRQLCSTAPVYAIGGNHDAATRSEDPPSAIRLFESIPNFHVVAGSVQTVRADRLSVAGVGSQCLLPSFPTWERSKTKRGRRALLLHTMIRGTVISPSGWVAEEGLELEKLESLIDRWELDRVFIGDIHLRQDITRNIHYVGSCIQREFGEEQEKGMLVWDVPSDTVQFIPLRSPQFITLRGDIDLKGLDDYNYYTLVPDTALDVSVASNVRVLPPPKTQTQVRLNLSPVDDMMVQWVNAEADVGDRARLLELGRSLIADTKPGVGLEAD